MANNGFFSNCVGLIYLAVEPPSIITAIGQHTSASIFFFFLVKLGPTHLVGLAPARYGWAPPTRAWTLQDILSLVFVWARINHPFITPAHLHYPHYCNTIARLLRNTWPPPDSPFTFHILYNISNDNIVQRLNSRVSGKVQSYMLNKVFTYSWDAATRIRIPYPAWLTLYTTCKNINRSHTLTPIENNTPDTETHAHDKNNTRVHIQGSCSHKTGSICIEYRNLFAPPHIQHVGVQSR